MNGTGLLAEFRKSGSDKAFGELVRRYTSLVYSVARRRLGNEAAAEDATQSVFIRLASHAPDLREDAALVAWLHRTTVHVSIDLWRAETRRRVREEHAAAMQTNDADESTWKELSPVIDEALNELTEGERQLILLRFFEHKSMRELGEAFGVSEDAAKMRVSRALERLRERVTLKGAACGAAALGAMLTDRAVQAAPASLLATLLCLNWPMPASLNAGKTLGSVLFRNSRMRIACVSAGVVLVGAWMFFATRSAQRNDGVPTAVGLSQSHEAVEAQASTPAPAPQVSVVETEPDPLRLLENVARARGRFQSGILQIGVQINHYFVGETNYKQIMVIFDAPKARFDSVERAYAYTSVGSDESARKIREQGLDRAAAVKAGLLQSFEFHVVSMYDGAINSEYRESDGRPEGANIRDPSEGTSEFLTNPQCFGLRTSLFVQSTAKGCLAYEEAKSITLIGKELVDGIPTWRVQVHSKNNDKLDFWIDAVRPERLLKQTYGQNFVLSRYEGSSTFPSEVIVKDFRDGKPMTEIRFTISSCQFNIPVPVATWTLSGLGMKIGTSVSDDRSSRGIGYWNGVGLSASSPGKGEIPEPAREMSELLALLESFPASPEAFEAARWILFNTPDGTEAEKAADVIRREHLRNTNVVDLCKRLEDARYRCATNLLKGFLDKNPSSDVRANACFLLATMKKAEANFGKNQKATAEAEKLFQRVVNDFGHRGKTGSQLAAQATRELMELRSLLIGMPAPEAEGAGFDGEPIRLSDYRGRIVVLVFWCCGYSEAREHAKFIETMAGKPVAFIGVCCDGNLKRAREGFAKYDITWPNIWDKRAGPIATAWNVHSFPNVWVIDAEGVIRFRDVRDSELVKAVDTLLGHY